MLHRKIESKNNQDFNTNLSHPNVELTWVDVIAWLLPLTLEPLTSFFSENNPPKINKFTTIYIRCNSCTDSYGNSVWVGIHILGDLWHCFTHLKWSDWAGMFNNLWKKGRIDMESALTIQWFSLVNKYLILNFCSILFCFTQQKRKWKLFLHSSFQNRKIWRLALCPANVYC